MYQIITEEILLLKSNEKKINLNQIIVQIRFFSQAFKISNEKIEN